MKRISISKCKVKYCCVLKRKECFKTHKSDECRGVSESICEAIRTPLTTSRKQLLIKMDNGSHMWWGMNVPMLTIPGKCKACGAEKSKNVEVLTEDYWLLNHGGYIEEKGETGGRWFNLTKKGQATAYNLQEM